MAEGSTVQHNTFGQNVDALGAASLSVDEKMTLITRNLQEVCKRELMTDILTKENRDLKIYWGTATTGKPHAAYFVPMSKIADFLRAGCHVTILFADIHGYLDNMKSTFELLKHRTEYYKQTISAMLTSIGVPLDKLHFRTGSSYQLTPEFTLDILKLTTLCSEHDAKKAGAEVVKQSESAPLSGLLYPIYQWLDEEYLDVDVQFGGCDQRKIFMSAEKYLPKIGYKQRAHLMNPMVPGLTGAKMSASDGDSKLGLTEDAAAVKRKIKKVFCEQGNIETPLLSFVKHVVFSVYGEFKLEQRDVEPIVYTEYAKLEADFAAGKIHPGDMKPSVVEVLNRLLEPIRQKFSEPEMVKLTELAYPTAVPEKKQKKQKQKQKGGSGGGAKPAAAAGGDAPAQSADVDVSRLDLRVGKIVSVEAHPNADSMYLEKIDFGEAEGPRQVVSGLVGKVAMEDLQDRLVIGVCNLKPANLRSIKSHAMLLCATSEEGTTECLDPPAGSAIGERLTAEGFSGAPDALIKPLKKGAKNSWELVQPDLMTSADKVATYKGVPLTTSKGPVTVKSVAGAAIK